MVRKTNTIHTTINKELKKSALLEDIDFAEAMEIGVSLLLKVNLSEEQSIMKEMDNLKKEIIFLQNKYKLLKKNLDKLRETKLQEEQRLKDLTAKKKSEKAKRCSNPGCENLLTSKAKTYEGKKYCSMNCIGEVRK